MNLFTQAMIAQVLCALALIHNSVARNDFIWSDGFESGLGNWSQHVLNAPHISRDYVRVNQGSTGSKGTGPTNAYEGSKYLKYSRLSPPYRLSLILPLILKSRICFFGLYFDPLDRRFPIQPFFASP